MCVIDLCGYSIGGWKTTAIVIIEKLFGSERKKIFPKHRQVGVRAQFDHDGSKAMMVMTMTTMEPGVGLV